jgi:phosphoribosylaminoimidazolecarboxamide formyltransferase/IMP cyclohydrolase
MPKRALLSVYDKTGIAALGQGLVDLGYEVVSTGGTWRPCRKPVSGDRSQ